MDTEEWILEKATEAAVPQLVTEAQAEAALAGDGPGLRAAAGRQGHADQRAVRHLPGGPGRSRENPRRWPRSPGPGPPITGGRVIGLTLSENAARVMQGEGLSEAWNITRFFANRVPVGPQ